MALTVCGKEDNEEGENGDEEGRTESGGRGEDGDIERSGLEEDSSSGSDSGDGEDADKEGERGDGEGRKDSGGGGVDSDNDSDLGEGNFSSDSEVEGDNREEVPDAITGTQNSRTGKGRKQKRSNSVAEHVSSVPAPTNKCTRGRARTPNARMRDQWRAYRQ